jgi:two-component system LytT family response regulator
MASSPRLRAVVIDDERLARRELRALLRAHDAIEVVGEAASATEALELVARLRPDVLFLDVQLNPGTGFDLIERLDHPARIVFVTAFDAFALRAFEVNALDYLLKPINPQRLAQAVERLAPGADVAAGAAHAAGAHGVAAGAGSASVPTPTPAHGRLHTSMADAVAPPPRLTFDDRLFVEAHGRSRFLPVSSVVRITAEGDYSQIHSSDGVRWLVLKSLREWEQRLPPQHFARIHRSMIVNLACVERLESAFSRGYLVYLRGMSSPVPMSRRRATVLKTLFG